MEGHDQYAVLLPAVLLLAAGLAAIALAKLTRVSAIVGFILAGVLLGPSGLQLVRENATTALLGELGVVFLLFEIGLHFSVEQLRKNPSDVLSLAPLQAVFCALAIGGSTLLFGAPLQASIAVGGALAISSTAVVMQVLSDRNQRSCPLGRSATTVLIVQDILAIFLLAYGASMMSENMEHMALSLGLAAGKALLGFILVLTIGPTLLDPAFRFLARTRNQEAFTAGALLLTLTLATASAAAGLSLTLGGFLAGMMIGGTRFRHIIETEAKPFRGLLLGFFFVTVGLRVDLAFLLANAGAVLGVTLGIMLLKTALNFLAALASRWSVAGAIQFAFLLSQGSEFAFVILGLPGVERALNPAAASLLITAIAASLALTGPWSFLGLRLARLVARARAKDANVEAATAAPEAERSPESGVFLLGMGMIGRRAADALARFQIRYVAIENDPDRFNAAIADGYDVAFGDPGDLRFMQTMGADQARVLAVSSPRYEVSRAVSPAVRDMYPKLARIVGVETEADAHRHELLGMRAVVNRSDPPGLDFASAVLAFAGLTEEQVARWRREETERARLDALAYEESFPSVSEAETV